MYNDERRAETKALNARFRGSQQQDVSYSFELQTVVSPSPPRPPVQDTALT